jgi:hypothetical protein
MLKTRNLPAKFAKSRDTAKNVRIRAVKTPLRTKKELRKNKKDEEEGRPSSSSFSFLGLKEEDAG